MLNMVEAPIIRTIFLRHGMGGGGAMARDDSRPPSIQVSCLLDHPRVIRSCNLLTVDCIC